MPIERARYDTQSVSGPGSIDAWEDYLQKIYYSHKVRAGASGDIYGHIEKTGFADLQASRHRANSHEISRTPALCATDPAERHAFVFVTAGKFDCRQSGREITVSSGGLFVLNASEAFNVCAADSTASATLTLPSDLCRSVIPNIDNYCCKPDHGDPVLNRALIGLIDGAFTSDPITDPFWLQGVCCDLLHTALNPRYIEREGRAWFTSDVARGLLLEKMRRVVEMSLHKVEFDVGEAAEACHVSTRHLQIVLKGIGTTFSAELLEARLKRAHSKFRSPSRGAKQIRQIAEECGFRTQAHFSTRYRERFGVRPKDEFPDIERR